MPPSTTCCCSEPGASPYRTSRGEDAAAFTLSDQRTEDWVKFVAVLVTVLGGLFVVWIYPPTGLADEFVDALVRVHACVTRDMGRSGLLGELVAAPPFRWEGPRGPGGDQG